jgi:hypothetical protein
MKWFSTIAAGVLAFGLTAARADETSVEVIPPTAKQPTPPTAGAPGSVEAAPAGSATMPSGADVNVNPPVPQAVEAETPVAPPPPVPAPQAVPVRSPGRPTSVVGAPRLITANSAAVLGGVTEPAIPVGVAPPPLAPVPFMGAQPPLGSPADHGTMHNVDHPVVGRLGAGFMIGGGYEDFTNSTLRSMTGGGGSWNARGVVGTRQYLGAEAAYVGAAHSVEALGVGSNALLVSNGLEGNARVNLPITMRHAQLLVPFGFIGLGWQHYQVTNTNTNTSDLAGKDDVVTMPVGGGLEYAIGRFMADARFTYRPTYYNDLMRNGGSLSNWGVGGQMGVSF